MFSDSIPGKGEIILFYNRSRSAPPTRPPSFSMGSGRVEALSLDVKRPRRQSEDPSSSSADVKNEWSFTATPPLPYNLMACRDKRRFTS